MCGIAGHWACTGKALDRNTASALTHSLAHRGPDGFGIENLDQGRLWLGHRRLSIIDVSERGRQPMSYAGGRYWLTYNGEIYNYIELREELAGKGHRFQSGSDSEVILAAFAEWGPDCQMRFNGMWAFAIWDDTARTLFLSRDRFGIKPMHYLSRDGAFCFASELKAFLALPSIDGSLDEAVTAETLININGQESTPHTLLSGIKRLPGGHCMMVNPDGTTSIRRWWDPLTRAGNIPADFPAQAQQFRELFFDSCRLRLRSDVPVATSLSGGLDSSAVACTLARLRGQGRADTGHNGYRAFVAGFPGTRLDEKEYARLVIEYTGMVPIYRDIDENVAATGIEKIVFDLEGIYWVPLVGPWSIYRAMREDGIQVSLDGHGADELLGGYNFFVERALDGLMNGKFSLKRYLDLRKVLTGLVGGSARISRASVMGELNWCLQRELTRLGLMKHIKPAAKLFLRAAALSRRLVQKGMGEAQAGIAAPTLSLAPLLPPYRGARLLYDENADPRTAGMSPLDDMLFTWFHGSVLPTILRSYDRASMSHGIEVRMPFMDWRLVTFGAALPEESKIGGGYTKRVLRQAMAGLMPDPIRLRTAKIGFTTPLDDWMRGGLKDWVLDTTSSRAFLESDIWNGKAARSTLECALEGQGSVNAVWPIINAFVLQKTFKTAAQEPPAEEYQHAV
ncbi:MAG: asparagine synthase (glutamine-hydrolyzing) [Bdellovibrionales bacterium]